MLLLSCIMPNIQCYFCKIRLAKSASIKIPISKVKSSTAFGYQVNGLHKASKFPTTLLEIKCIVSIFYSQLKLQI